MIESAFKGFIVLRLRIALLDGVVAGDEDTLRPKFRCSTLDLASEGVVISPHLHVVSTNQVGCHLLDEYIFLAVVIVPPLSASLEVSIRGFLPSSFGFTGACRTIVPEVLELCVWFLFGFEVLVDVN